MFYSASQREEQAVVDLYDAASYHSLVLGAAGRSQRTTEAYLTYERRFLEFLASRKVAANLDALNAVNVRQAIMWLQRSGRGKRSGAVAVRQFGVIMKAWAGMMTREGILPNNPLERLPVPKVLELEPQPYTSTEVLAMLEVAKQSRTPTRDRLLVHLLLDTGVRIGELTGLTVDRLRLDPPERRLTVIGKGNKERSVPFGDPSTPDGGDTVRLLRAYLREREAIFVRFPARTSPRLLLTWQGFPLTVNGAEDVIRRLGWQAGVPEAVPHRFRHSFATIYLTEYPGDEQGLRDILGHVDVEIMRHYLHLSRGTIAQRAGRVSPSQRWLKRHSS